MGTVNGYTVIVMYLWPRGKAAMNIDVLFDPRLLGGFISSDDIKQIGKRNKKSSFWSNNEYLWSPNSVGFLIEYSIAPPPAEKIISKANEMVGILIKEN